MKKEDMIIYGCVIIGGGIGFLIDNPLPAVCIGLGVGYLIKIAISSK